jgi:hypothetical protein
MTPPTQTDAQLMIQIAQWGTSLGLQDAMPEIFGPDFDPAAEEAMTNASVRMILTFGESIATLTKHDLLSEELVKDWIWVEGLWARVGPAALRQREAMGEPRLYENFEALATG